MVILGRKGCRLCDAAEAQLKSMEGTQIEVKVIDIDEDPALHDKYVLRIPVVSVGGEDVFEAAMMDTEGKWKELLRSLMKASQGSLD